MEQETIIIQTGKKSSCLKETKFGGDPKSDCVSVHIGHPETVTVFEGHPDLYTESEVKAERLAGQYEAWELARKIVCAVSNGGYSVNDLTDIYDLAWSGDILAQYGYGEAAHMVQKWEEEIRVGDVVKLHWGGEADHLAVVTWAHPDSKLLSILLDNGNVGDIVRDQCVKIDKKLNIAALLVELNGKEEN